MSSEDKGAMEKNLAHNHTATAWGSCRDSHRLTKQHFSCFRQKSCRRLRRKKEVCRDSELEKSPWWQMRLLLPSRHHPLPFYLAITWTWKDNMPKPLLGPWGLSAQHPILSFSLLCTPTPCCHTILKYAKIHGISASFCYSVKSAQDQKKEDELI